MRVYSNILGVIMLISLVINNVMGQTTVTIYPYTVMAVYYYDPENEVWVYVPGAYQIGRLDGAVIPNVSVNDIHRTAYQFDLSQIPSDATIEDAKILIDGISNFASCTTCEARLVSLAHDLPLIPEDVWQAVGNGSVYFDNISYNASFIELSSQALIDDIQNSLSVGHINIGGLSLNEDQNETEADLLGIRMEITYSVPPNFYDITVENSFSGGQVRVDGQLYDSGATFSWEENSQHTLEAFDQDWPAPNNYFRVFREWQEGGNTWTTNPLTITVSGDATYQAVFRKRFDFQVSAMEFLNGGSGNTIRVNGQNETVPYFTHIIEGNSIEVEAPPQSQIINGRNVDFHLVTWSDGGTANPRIFTPIDHRNYTITMKGHLVSDTYRATARNNARRIAKDDQGRLHVVYEDEGKIFYTYSTDEGNTWAPETQVGLAYSGEINRYPVVAVAGDILHVVWTLQYRNTNPYIIDILHTTLNLTTGTWSTPEFVTPPVSQVIKIPAPALAVLRENPPSSYRVVMVVDVHEVGMDPQIYTYHYANSSWNQVNQQLLNGSNPTLASETSTGAPLNDFLYLAYERNGELYGRLWNKTNHEWEGEAHLTGNAPPGIHQRPSLSLYRGFGSNRLYGVLVWEIWNDAVPLGASFRSIAYRRIFCPDPSLEENEVTLFTGNNPQYPSISSWGLDITGNERVSIFYEENGQIVKQVYDGNHWSGQFIGDGRSPNVIAQGHSGLNFHSAGMVYTRDAEPPHRLAFDYLQPVVRTPGGQMVLDSLITYKRLDYFWPPDSAGVLLSLDIREPQAAGQPLQFNWKPVSDEFTVHSTTDSFTCQLTGRFYYSQTAADSQQVLFRLQFVESTGAVHPLMEMHLGEWLPYNDGEEHTVPLTVSLASVANLTGRLWFDYPRSLGYVRDVVEWPDSTAGKMAQMNPSGQGEGLMAMPVEFTLHPNYPNPFNPMTNVEFGIGNAELGMRNPRPGRGRSEWVTLKIYDILGREVKTLVNRRLTAGRYTVQWDGTDEMGRPVASGVYLYRLQAGERVLTRKMMLVR